MTSVLLLGATGMVGSHLLSTLRSSAQVSRVEVIARRSPKTTTTSASTTYNEHVSSDLSSWESHISSLSPPPSIMMSALATTRGAAGGFEKQYALEHDLNVSLAKAAKDAGTKTYVLISSASASPSSMFGYTKMKGEIEEHIKDLNFEHTIILRPGLIAGSREESRPFEAGLRKIAGALGSISSSLKDPWAQEADTIARAAVRAGIMATNGEGQGKEKVWILPQSDIVRLGKNK